MLRELVKLQVEGLASPPGSSHYWSPTCGRTHLWVWSSGDFALTEKQMSGSAAPVAGARSPGAVNGLLVDFLSG